jgi:hypothetical protein
MKSKHIVCIYGTIIGIAGATAVDLWPEHAAPIQMALYSAIVLGVIFSSFWEDRHHPKYLAGMSVLFLLHCICIFFSRSYFPFKTILAIIPMVVMEFIVLMMVMIKIRGDREPEQNGTSPPVDSKTTPGQMKSAKRRGR